MKVLILGSNGMLGHKLVYHLAKDDRFEITGTIRRNSFIFPPVFNELNISLISNVDCRDSQKIRNLVSEVDVVINGIAQIKQKENISSDEFLEINGIFPHKLAQLCWFSDKRLIHISTDCVFSGKHGNYSEKDVPDPIDVYGISKAAGEINYGNTLTLRTSIIGTELNTAYGLLEWFRKNTENTVNGFTKALWSGFTTDWLSEIIIKIITDFPSLRGLYNVGLKQPIDKFSILQKINTKFNLGKKIKEDSAFIINRSLNSELFFEITKFPRPSISQQIANIVDLSEETH